MRRRATGRRRRGPRRLTDWIPCQTGIVGANVTDNIATTTFNAWIDLTDMDTHVDRFTVCRVVGEVYFCFGRNQELIPTGSILVSWGFYVASLNDTGGAIVLDPGSDLSADSEDWMFRRTVPVVPSNALALAAGMFNDYDSAHFDTKVMRKMEGRQTLNFVAIIDSVCGIVTPVSAEAYVNVRALVKLA